MFPSAIHRPISDGSSDLEGSLLKGFLTRRSRGREHFAVSLYHPKEAVGVSLRQRAVHGDAFAPLSPPILFSVGKSCGGLLGDHQEHVANDLTCLCPLSRVGYRAFSCHLDNKFTDRIALICPSLPPTDD